MLQRPLNTPSQQLWKINIVLLVLIPRTLSNANVHTNDSASLISSIK